MAFPKGSTSLPAAGIRLRITHRLQPFVTAFAELSPAAGRAGTLDTAVSTQLSLDKDGEDEGSGGQASCPPAKEEEVALPQQTARGHGSRATLLVKCYAVCKELGSPAHGSGWNPDAVPYPGTADNLLRHVMPQLLHP